MRLIAVVVAVLFAAQSEEKVEFKFSPKKGDKLKQSAKMEFQMKLTVDAGGQTQEMELEHRATRTRTTEYADVADGKLTTVVVDSTEDFEEQKQPPAMEWQRTDKAMHGRKVTISQKDGQLVREGAEGLKESDMKDLDLKNPHERVYPKKSVGIGEEWELKGEAVREFLGSEQGELKDATLKMKLKEVKEIDKRRCAVLTGKLEAKGKAPNDFDFKVAMDFDLVVWLERGYLLSAKGKGKVSISGGSDEYSATGDGPITMEMAQKVE